MIKKYSFFFILFAFLLSCNSDSQKDPTTDVEVARAFIRDILDNKFDEAEKFLLKDETNQQYFERFRQTYNAQGKDKLEKYRSADIIVNNVEYIVADSICIFNYSNSYIRDVKNKLKLVRVDNKWLVDLKYTFSGNL